MLLQALRAHLSSTTDVYVVSWRMLETQRKQTSMAQVGCWRQSKPAWPREDAGDTESKPAWPHHREDAGDRANQDGPGKMLETQTASHHSPRKFSPFTI